MGELQIAPNGEKLVWHSHSKKIAGFDHKTTTIYEIALNSDKITSTGISTNVTTTGGSYAPQAGIAYQGDSENLLYTQHDLYNASNNTSGGKLWKYDQLSLTSLPLSQNLVYLLGDIKRGVNGNLYIPNVYESGADLHHYSTQNGVTTTSNIFPSSTTEERLSGTLPTQVYKLVADNDDTYYRIVGSKSYELKDHLGNVRAVITDQKLLEDVDGNDEINLGDYYTANVVSFSDYFPFGMQMPGRSGGSEDYRYNFQGQETDDEVKGKGNSVNYKYRMHDPRLGRFFAVDPLTSKYPHYTPYSFSGNKVIHAVELEGLEERVVTHTTQPTEGFDDNGNRNTTDCQSMSVCLPNEYGYGNTGTLHKYEDGTEEYFGPPTVRESAEIAEHVYSVGQDNNGKIVYFNPANTNWKVSNEANDLTLRFSSGFNSALYKRTDPYDGTVYRVYATAGTDDLPDVRTDAAQALGLYDKQYIESTFNAQILNIRFGDNLTFVGHSLGGGLAEANALKTGLNAITFNAAGLADGTKEKLGLTKLANVNAYVIQGEILNKVQFDKAGGNWVNLKSPVPYTTFEIEIAKHPYLIQGHVASSVQIGVGMINADISLKNHTMGNVLQSIKLGGYK
jgi:RHS repeat-associated protein